MKFRILYMILLAALIVNSNTRAQSMELDKDDFALSILGTSSIHDWEIKAEKISGGMNLLWEDQNISGIKELELTIPAESLKSGKKGMDRNTYKALNTNSYPDICFRLHLVEKIEKIAANNYQLVLTGYLKIAGTEKLINLPVQLQTKPAEIIISGETAIRMTDYKIKPPTAMFGTITTGDRVIIQFTLPFKN